MKDYEYSVTGKLTEDCQGLEIDNARSIIRILRLIKDDALEITIRKFHRQRSVAQNAWLWGVCIVTIRAWMLETTGECPSKEAIYAFLRIKVIGQEVVIEDVNGIDIAVVSGKRFSAMTTTEFSDAVDKIIFYYAELGCEIKLPIPKSNNYLTDYIKIQDE